MFPSSSSSFFQDETSNKDRISELPDSILLHILSFLPAKDAVYNAVLISKRWLPLRPYLPSLIFIEPVPNYYSFGESFRPPTTPWSSLVDATLIRYYFHNVQRFCIACDYKPFAGADYNPLKRKLQVDSWVSFAVQRKSVKQLELLFNYTSPEEMYCLPRFLFRHDTLTSLSLRSCVLKDCGNTITWTSLKSLSIEDSLIGLNTWRKILVGCPGLECLKLVRCNDINYLEIVSDRLKELVLDHCYFRVNSEQPDIRFRVSAPKLRVLVISGFMRYRECTIETGPCLVEATFKEEPLRFAYQQDNTPFNGRVVVDPYIYIDDTDYANSDIIESAKFMVREFLRCAQHVKKLSMGSWCLQVYLIESLPNSFSSCKSLTLDTNLKQWELPGLAVVLQNCPKLESLTINMWTTKSDIVPCQTNSECNEATFPTGGQYTCLEQHLKNVKLFNLSPIPKGGTLVIEFLKFLFKHGRVLEKLSITTEMHCRNKDGFAVDQLQEKNNLFEVCLFEMLSNQPRSSPNVVIQVN